MHEKVGTLTRTSMVTSAFKDRDSAERAFADLQTRGYSNKDIQPSYTNGTLTKDKDGYIFRPGKMEKL